MIVTLEEAKQYLRVDFPDDDELINQLIMASQKLCMDICRIGDEVLFETEIETARPAVYYALAYLYEHREEANHQELTLTLRALLFGIRTEGF